MNPRPAAYKAAALPAELPGRILGVLLLGFRCYIVWVGSAAVRIVIRARIRVRMCGFSFSDTFRSAVIARIEIVMAVMLEEIKVIGEKAAKASRWIMVT